MTQSSEKSRPKKDAASPTSKNQLFSRRRPLRERLKDFQGVIYTWSKAR